MAIAKGLLVVTLAFFSCLVTISEAGMWCVANPQISDVFIQREIDKLCANGGISYHLESPCKKIKSGGPCFQPNTVKFHASVLFNSLYTSGGEPNYCANGRGVLVGEDPSTKTCKFVSIE